MKTGNIILFVLCGIAIAIGMIIYFEASAFQKTAKITTGTVVNSSLSRYEIKYTSDDKIERTYKGIHSSKGGRYQNGDIVKVFYQTSDPDKMRTSDGKRGGKKIVFWTFIMILFNLFSVYHGRKRDKTEIDFKTTGRKVEAQILRIETDMETTVLQKHPYLIDCKWVIL